MPPTILLVEDEMRIGRWTLTYIEKAGFEGLWATNGEDGLHMALTDNPDLIVLDIMLPRLDGWEVCQRVREQSDVPIIMLTARITDEDVIKGLELGADDYMKKPFNADELIARIRSNLRRASGDLKQGDTLTVGLLFLDGSAGNFTVGGSPVALTAQQFDIMRFFMEYPNQVLSREQIIDHVFGLDYDAYERAIDVHISRLRQKIKKATGGPAMIETVFGRGYKLSVE